MIFSKKLAQDCVSLSLEITTPVSLFQCNIVTQNTTHTIEWSGVLKGLYQVPGQEFYPRNDHNKERREGRVNIKLSNLISSHSSSLHLSSQHKQTQNMIYHLLKLWALLGIWLVLLKDWIKLQTGHTRLDYPPRRPPMKSCVWEAMVYISMLDSRSYLEGWFRRSSE